jgi:hypothetical protein
LAATNLTINSIKKNRTSIKHTFSNPHIKNKIQEIARLTRRPKQPKLKQSSFDVLFEEFGETVPYDIQPPIESNDNLQSSLGKDRTNRREDVATAALEMERP